MKDDRRAAIEADPDLKKLELSRAQQTPTEAETAAAAKYEEYQAIKDADEQKLKACLKKAIRNLCRTYEVRIAIHNGKVMALKDGRPFCHLE